MQTELQAELILCPNCREEVPKTLYCLNCGYPLYKLEQKQLEPDEDVSIEVAPEAIEVESIEEQVIETEASSEEESLPEAPIEESLEEIEADTAPEPVTVIESVEPVETVKLLESAETEEVVEVETELEPLSEAVEEDIALKEEVTAPVEELVEDIEEIAVEEDVEITVEEDVESVEAEEPEVIEEPEVEEEAWGEVIVEEPVQEEEAEPTPEFEPDPVIREVMENLAKNISLKIRLVSLLVEGDVKEETFNRLFEGYAARGERLINSRNETLERIRFDLDTMEGALEEAKFGLEELEIRRSIGDASEDEYRAKAPAFEWDISQYNDEVMRKKGEIAYLDNLACIVSNEDMDELKDMAETSYEAVDSIVECETISSEMAARIKVTLEESLACLKGSA